MKVRVDREECTGDAICADMCPDVFEIDDEGIAVVLVDTVPKDLEDDVREACDSCPEECIYIDEDDDE